MRRLLSIPFQLWIRIALSIIFFLGGAFMVFWAQGFRFDFSDGSIVSTGVVSVSTVPSDAHIVISSEVVGSSPTVILGIPLGPVKICIYRNGFIPFCDSISVGAEAVTYLKNIYLVSQSAPIKEWGTTKDFLWDPLGRGFIQRFPSLSSALIYDGGEVRFLDSLGSDVFLTRRGDLLLPFVSEQQIFYSSQQSRCSCVLPDSSGHLFFHENVLSIRWINPEKELALHTFTENIEEAYFLANSESILVATSTHVYLIQRAGTEPVELFQKDNSSKVRYFPSSQTLFYENAGNIFSYEWGNE